MSIYDYIIHDYKPDMGKRIRACRLQSSLTQENMAELLDVSVKHYSEVERGLIGLSIEKLLYLSHFFNVSLDYLLKGDGEPSPIPGIVLETYRSCPDDKKECFVKMVNSLYQLIN